MRSLVLRNPVLNREITERFRTPRAAIMLSIYLCLVAGVLIAVYWATVDDASQFGSSPVTRLASTGRTLFETTLFISMILVLFLVPGFSAGAISGERDRQTLLPVQISLMRPIDIVIGKVLASLGFTVMLVIVTIPLLTLSYMIGGVTVGDIVTGVLMVVFSGLVITVLSVACSAATKRVQTSTVMAYGLVLILVLGTFGAFGVARMVDRTEWPEVGSPPTWMLVPNPLIALAEVSGGERQFDRFTGGSVEFGPLTALRQLAEPNWGEVFFDIDAQGDMVEVRFDNAGRQVFGESSEAIGSRSYLILMVLVMPLALWFAARRVRTPAKMER